MTTEITVPGFDYGQLDGENWQFVQDAADEIRRLGKQTVENLIEIGRRLTAVQERLPYGQWGIWLEIEREMSETTARRCMNRYALARSATVAELDILLALPATVVADIAAPSVPEPARREILEAAADGERMTREKVKEIADQHRQPSHPRKTRSRFDRICRLYRALTPRERNEFVRGILMLELHYTSSPDTVRGRKLEELLKSLGTFATPDMADMAALATALENVITEPGTADVTAVSEAS